MDNADIPAELLSPNHWRIAGYSQRMTVADWRRVLLAERETVIFNGRAVQLVAVPLGYGVVQVCKAPEAE